MEIPDHFTGFLKKQTLRSGGISYYPRYRCGNKFERHSSACLTERKIESYLIDHIFQSLADQEQQFISNESQKKKPDQTEKIRAEMQRLNTMYQKGRIEESFYDSEYARLEQLLSGKKQQEHTVQRFTQLAAQFSGDWLSIYERLDNEHKRAFWKTSIKKINVDPETHEITGFQFII